MPKKNETSKTQVATQELITQYYGSRASFPGIGDASTPLVTRVITVDGLPALFMAGPIPGHETKFHVYGEFKCPDGSLAAAIRGQNDDGSWMTYQEAIDKLNDLDDSYDHLLKLAEEGWNYINYERDLFDGSPNPGAALSLEDLQFITLDESEQLDDDASNDEIDAAIDAFLGRTSRRKD